MDIVGIGQQFYGVIVVRDFLVTILAMRPGANEMSGIGVLHTAYSFFIFASVATF